MLPGDIFLPQLFLLSNVTKLSITMRPEAHSLLTLATKPGKIFCGKKEEEKFRWSQNNYRLLVFIQCI
jgi:hypothetical protein